ncbi:MAG: FKBP-type peptidyl-prolyl cis-trans isomerase, partial [Candidatus Thorarchaeota archaeon]|nr:FKBP-type peptidyl-prolyl cis-trans isomerase [Candidatus Thorarchaeota archaeon]
MGLLQQRIATALLLTLLLSSSVMAIIPVDSTWDSGLTAPGLQNQPQVSESLLNLSIPYVDNHYGSPDGIIDPKEYAFNYTDPVTGITVYLEKNSTVLFLGLDAETTGWIGFGWKNYSDNFLSEGLNNSDLIYGYTPGTIYDNVERVGPDDVVTVHYVLSVRNGTFVEEGNVPNDESTTPIASENLLQAYKDEVIGMRIGEVRHFIIPAENAYNDPTHPFYGFDLEYVITLSRINSNYINPGDRSGIVYSDEHGISTFQHQPDANQSRILLADGSDNGVTTRLEYFIQMNSTDIDDISLLNATGISYPLMLMYGNTEDIFDLPVQHSEWETPPMMTLA